MDPSRKAQRTTSSRFREDVGRGRAFERVDRTGWQVPKGGEIRFEASTKWLGRRGRIDIRIDDPGNSVAVVELKATNWDKLGAHRVRATALRHARQLWRYVNAEVIDQRRDVCPGIVYEQEPREPSRRDLVERVLHAQCIQVVWRNG